MCDRCRKVHLDVSCTHSLVVSVTCVERSTNRCQLYSQPSCKCGRYRKVYLDVSCTHSLAVCVTCVEGST